jgi:H+-transporting ATPase
MKDKTVAKVSVFEQKVLQAVRFIISIALIDVMVIFIVQGTVRKQFNMTDITTDFLTCLSIIVAAIPVALPIVMQVTMALGAGKMAREYNSVVTALPALQDIASMTILCSDKTGTLTTARISIHAESVWCSANFTKQDVALYAVLASNRDKKEDAIDRSVVGYFDRVFGDGGLQLASEYTKTRSVGFNPIYKRVLYEYSHPKVGKITIAKGLPNKVLDTADGGVDDADDQWKCQDYLKLRDEVKKVDYDFSKAGYKTLGVAVKINDGPFIFCGILPMLDPPRHDTAQTIRNLVNAGIEVKMITGDHLNIAKETARLIGMGVDIQAGEATREESHAANPAGRYDLIRAAHGFAQVLPKDKREVVQVLRNTFTQVVGMTGDGVNDAPALSAAQCGIAVHDATDAAKNAAAIILTSEGLSAIYRYVHCIIL